MSLRSDLIDVMADAVYANKWPGMTEPRPGTRDVELASAVLDAAIAFLTEHADEWDDLALVNAQADEREWAVGPIDFLEALSAPINPEGE